MCGLGVAILMVLGSANAATLFQDTFDGTGALGDGWDSWTNTFSGAVHGQSGGSYVFDHTGTNWAQAAVQSDPVYITAYDAVDFKFHIKDFGGSDVSNSIDGATSFMVAEGEEPALDDLLANTTYPLDGLVLMIPHNTINFGSYPDAASDPRTWVEIWKSDYSTLLGKIVVQATNDFTLVVSLNYDAWSVDVEGASFWVAEGWSHGLHGYDLWSWATGARLRMESWNVSGDFGPASIDAVTIEATPKAIPFFFEDTFDGTGALGDDWGSWQEGASGANPGQANGCYVFDNIGASWAQAAVQTTNTVDIASTVNAAARFHIKDYSGSAAWDGMAAGITSFIFAEYDPVLDSLYDTSIDGIILSVEHQSINGGSWPDAASDPRTWVQIKKTDDTVLGVVVVQSTNDYTMALIMTTNTWEFGVEGAAYWIDSGTTSGLHGYDLSTWADGACLRMESWNADGDWRPAKINSASIEVPPPYYEKWTLDNFLFGTNALRTVDVDIDGMINLFEYAIGGNPRVYDTVVLPTAAVVEDTGTNWFEYVYNRRFDYVARGLDYDVILSSDLTSGSWSNIGTSAETGSAMINSFMETVTNRIHTTEDVKFSRLEITEN